jgi:putative glycosyltransferase (TIGR04348 family)
MQPAPLGKTHVISAGVDGLDAFFVKDPLLKCRMKRSRLLIIVPATAAANNGNWQTAQRWSRMLRPTFQITLAQGWNGEPFDVMLALHARRSAESIARWPRTQGADAVAPGLGVVLTGTDLYRDIQSDASAQASLAYAQQLVVLQECAPDALPVAVRPKARVIFQSVGLRQTAVKPGQLLRAVMVGHLREEKSPQTLFNAARRLKQHPDIHIDHIGDALDAELGRQAQACAAECPRYRWLGGLAHDVARRRIQRAHVLVHASRMEGGAHVVMEAICSGTPVLASRIPGNVGMLGAGYAGYFEHGNAQELADLLLRLRAEQKTADGLYRLLQAQCAQRAPLFAPAAEKAALTALMRDLLQYKTNPETALPHACA